MHDVYTDLGESSRRLILSELLKGPRNVSELVSATGLSQPNVSNHLARMRGRRIVTAEKQGRQVIYNLASAAIRGIVSAALDMHGSKPRTIVAPDWCEAYASRAVSGDELSCQELIDQAFVSGLTLLEIYERLISPSLRTLGDWWKDGRITVGQEHLASGITERVLTRCMQVVGPGRAQPLKAILGCAPGVTHTFALRMVSDYLRSLGWQTLYLGGDVPNASMQAAILDNQPNLVLTSCIAEDSVAATLSQVATLRSTNKVDICVGGQAASEHRDGFIAEGATYVCANLEELTDEVLATFSRGLLARSA